MYGLIHQLVKGFVSTASCFILFCTLGVRPAHARVELQPCKTNMSPERQIELGSKAVQQVYKEMPVLPDSDPVVQYVQALGQRLVAEAPGYKWPYNFHVVNVDDINAFALPGGSIFVNLGTIQAADTEAQLAGVMAHEISHVVLQHSVCNLEKQQRVGIFAGLGQIASGVMLGDSALGTLAEKGIGLTAGLGFLKMSRGAEQQADLEGVGILYDTGYDPRGMPQFFETVEAKYGKGGAQMLSDHPNPGNRTEYINREIATLPPLDHPIANTPEFRDIHRTAAKMHTYTAKEVSSGAWKKSTNPSDSNSLDRGGSSASSDLRIDTAVPQNWTVFHGNGFSISVPSDWQMRGDRNASEFAPPNGVTQSDRGQQGNLIYGLVTETYPPDEGASLRQSFNALVQKITSRNPGLELGTVSRMPIGDLTVETVECVNRSAQNGRGEHVWIAGTPTGNVMRYFVFVAPQPDFDAVRPIFGRILNSISLK